MKSALFGCGLALAMQAAEATQITFYEGEGFRGRAFTTDRRVENFKDFGFNDRASSVVVDSGRWEVCEDSRYTGHCVLLRPGAYDSLSGMGVNNRVTSVRLVSDDGRRDYADAPPPRPYADYEWRRRPNERVYQAHVTSVRAVMGPEERHCWVDREQVRERGNPNVGGAIAGAIIGGVIGHQIGSGSGRDIATVGGAVVGGAVGSNVNRDHDRYTRDIRRCETSYDGPPDYWDVTYDYHGVEHYVQMTDPPGNTILVNRDGEPRQ
ncbi:MAG TPA: beta/gamma crystallin-related protein [Steroidobacteraceae bacterium]|nr:beta/gamma crystallin-related protein [Steroidobacteraceae bacterium]